MRDESLHILLVEDDDIDSEMVVRSLSYPASHFTITATGSALEALAILHGQAGYKLLGRPYVILLDLGLPGMNGIEFLQVLRQDPVLRQSIVFVITCSTSGWDKAAVDNYNVAKYLVKEKLDYIQLRELLQVYRQGLFDTPPVSSLIKAA